MGSQLSKKSDRIYRVLMYVYAGIYLIALTYFLFFSEKYGRVQGTTEYKYNLVLLKEIKRYLVYHNEIGVKAVFLNLAGNILAFTPFGLFLPMFMRSKGKLIYVIICTFLFSLLVEVLQLIFRVGIFDVDDLLLNTIGGILGFGIYRILHFHMIRRRKARMKPS